MEEDLSLDNICKQYYQTIYRYCLFKTNHNKHLRIEPLKLASLA